ncbi:MAG TPA: amino acid adenylation domain-containing protein, partial [Gemmatimonadales bacterium]|nr:amino acid adenylation domain-containing protein [Gemmatimonadales bacterium]
VLVGRRAGLTDFVLGAVSANRTQRDTEDLIGAFMTIVPLRARLDDAPGFRTHLRRTSASLGSGLPHQAFPFQRLMSTLRAGANAGGGHLYDVVFNYRNMPASLPVMHGLAVSDFRAPHLDTMFDLHLGVTPEAGRIVLELDYNPELIEQGTAVRWLAGYRVILEAVATDPDTSVAMLPIMPLAERRLLVEEWSGATVPAPVLDFVMDRFDRAAVAYPDSPAIEHGNSVLSYADLRARAYRVTAHLRHAGVARGDLVGLFADRSIDSVAAMLGILAAGAVYVPLDTRAPDRRIDAILDSARLRLILSDRTGAPALARRHEPTLNIADLLEQAPPAGGSDEPAVLRDGDGAYVIFTSGSTGVPKGVAVPHGALARHMTSAVESFGSRRGDRMLQFAALTFDVSFKEMFLPLCTGGTLVLRSETMFDSAAAFAEQCRTLGLTHVWIPTAFWSEITRADWPGGLDLGAVRVVNVGGAAAQPGTVRRFFEVLSKPVRIFNCYGPTETTIACTWAELAPGEDLPGVPIGRPLPGVTAYVLDPHDRPVPIGVAGELCIGGANLATGYLGAPEQTASRFVADPFSQVPGARLYRTGDTVYWLQDGRLCFLGRGDFQVKVRGHRVELQEIERVLQDIPGVRHAAVLFQETDRLIAFVVPDHSRLLSDAAIRDAAALALPVYMLPSRIVSVERLPVGPTGKVDRHRLLAMIPAGADPAGGRPATATERTIARIWEEVLGVSGIGPENRFLDLGGHSLLAMRVAKRVEAQLGIHVSIRTLLDHSTVRALARELDRLATTPGPRS